MGTAAVGVPSAHARSCLQNDVIVGLSLSIYSLTLNRYVVSTGYSRSPLGGFRRCPT